MVVWDASTPCTPAHQPAGLVVPYVVGWVTFQSPPRPACGGKRLPIREWEKQRRCPSRSAESPIRIASRVVENRRLALDLPSVVLHQAQESRAGKLPSVNNCCFEGGARPVAGEVALVNTERPGPAHTLGFLWRCTAWRFGRE